MNEELQKALVELLNKTLSGIDSAGEFMAAQIPDVVQQLLMWHSVYSLIVSSMCLALLFFAIKLDIRLFYITKGRDDEDFLVIGYFLIGSIVRAILYAFLLSGISLDWLQIWLAPKVWLLEYASKLTN